LLRKEQVLAAVRDVAPILLHREHDVTNDELMKDVVPLTNGEQDDSALMPLATSMQRLMEQDQRAVREQQRELLQQLCLPEELQHDFVHDVEVLKRIFDRLDTHGHGTLDGGQHARIVKELGLGVLPESILSAPPMAFPELLRSLLQLRRAATEALNEPLGPVFERFSEVQRPGPNGIAVEEDVTKVVSEEMLPALLKDMGVKAVSAEEEEAVCQVLEEVDLAGTGRFDFATTRIICQITAERIKQWRFLRELDLAHEFGFDMQELLDIRKIFTALDDSGDCLLDRGECWEGLKRLDEESARLIPFIQFQAAFSALDQDNSGFLDSAEFIELVKRFRDREGAFKDHSQIAVTTLQALHRTELLVLLDALEVPFIEAERMEQDELVDKVALKLGNLSPGEELHTRLAVSTLADLMALARMRREIEASHVRERPKFGLGKF
jgi:hypothetical protein